MAYVTNSERQPIETRVKIKNDAEILEDLAFILDGQYSATVPNREVFKKAHPLYGGLEELFLKSKTYRAEKLVARLREEFSQDSIIYRVWRNEDFPLGINFSILIDGDYFAINQNYI